MSTPYGYQPDPNQGGQGQQYDATQFAPAPQWGQDAQPAQPQGQQYGQPPSYGQAPGQYGQAPQADPGAQYGQAAPGYGAPSYGQSTPQYGSAPQYGAPQQQYGSAPGYGQATPQYGQQAAPQYGAAQPGYGQPGYGGQQAYGAYGAVPVTPGGPTTPYLSGADVGFGAAIGEAFKNAFNYSGRISKSSYWYAAGPAIGIMLVLYLIAVTSGGFGFIMLESLVDLGIAVVMLPAAWRRLQDTGKSGALALLWLIPFVGFIIVLILCSMSSTPGPNQYGDQAGSAPGGYRPGY